MGNSKLTDIDITFPDGTKISMKKEASNTSKTRKSMGDFLKEILTGEFLRNKHLINQIDVIIWAVILAFIYMNNRMICDQGFKEIDQLRKELANEKYIAMITESQLLNISRIGTVKELIEKHNLQLIEEDKPSYLLIINQEE